MSTDVLEEEKRETEGSSETSGIYIWTNYVIFQERVRLFIIVTSWETQISRTIWGEFLSTCSGTGEGTTKWRLRCSGILHSVGLTLIGLTFKGPCIANTRIFAEYNQQDAKFLNLFISVRWSTCFRRVFRPSSGAQNCTYSVRYLSDLYCYLLLAWPG